MTIEREFGADPDLKTLYQVYLAIVLLGGFLWWMIPAVAFVMLAFDMQIGVVAVALSSFVPLIIVAGFTLYWIPKFHSSINYVLEDDKITVTKGMVEDKKLRALQPHNQR